MNLATTKCLVCKNEIKAGAKKCTACDSYQDWTRYIFRYTAVITAFLGIVPVITIAASLYQIAFGEKEADVRAAIIRCESRRLDIGIANVGEMPAIVSNLRFRSPNTDPGLTPVNFAVRRTGGDGMSTYLVDPAGKAKIVTYQPYIGNVLSRFPKFPENAALCKYHLLIETVEFDSKKKSQELTCNCSKS